MSKKNDSNKHKEVDVEELEQQVGELTADLQRTRADFENYRKRVDEEKDRAREAGKSGTILKLLPIVDNIERAVAYAPESLKDDKWAQGVVSLVKTLENSLAKLGVERIESTPGTEFNPELHEAIQFEEDTEGDTEVVAEEMQAGYTLDGVVVRHAMVKVARK